MMPAVDHLLSEDDQNIRPCKNVSGRRMCVRGGVALGNIDDPRHSQGEERFVLLLGQSKKRRLLVVMFTERG